MKFASYYDVTNKLNQLLNKKMLSSYTKNYCKSLFICKDTHCFWISRVLEGYNSEFEQEEGKWLIEVNKIDKYDFIDFIENKTKENLKVENRQDRDNVINCLTDGFIIKNVILMDDGKELENWDNVECNSYEEVIQIIDNGYGIINLNNKIE